MDKIMRVKLLSELLGGDLVKYCFIWPIAPHTGTHLLQLLYEPSRATCIGQVHVHSDASYLALLLPQRHTYTMTCTTYDSQSEQ